MVCGILTNAYFFWLLILLWWSDYTNQVQLPFVPNGFFLSAEHAWWAQSMLAPTMIFVLVAARHRRLYLSKYLKSGQSAFVFDSLASACMLILITFIALSLVVLSLLAAVEIFHGSRFAIDTGALLINASAVFGYISLLFLHRRHAFAIVWRLAMRHVAPNFIVNLISVCIVVKFASYAFWAQSYDGFGAINSYGYGLFFGSHYLQVALMVLLSAYFFKTFYSCVSLKQIRVIS
jgi:hypothetical protein